jgi:2-amino-4-hydroxy-6-hydroxymethyldihydropteridine diphosphokinase
VTIATAAGDVRTDTAVVATGSNVGHRGRSLARLRELLQRDGVVIESASSEILTRPVGVTGQADFHNQVLRLRAPDAWSPQHWVAHCRRAEVDAGRRVTYRWGPRRADVDILLLGRSGELSVVTAELTVPHPQMANRPFVGRLLAQLR